MSKYTKYLVVYRESPTEAWSLGPYFIDTLKEAQHKLLNYSKGSEYDWNIFVCKSILLSAHGEDETQSPDIVSGSKRVSATK